MMVQFKKDFWEYDPSTTLYADFAGYGLYTWDGSTWSQLHSLSPASIAVSGSTLYATFTGYGL